MAADLCSPVAWRVSFNGGHTWTVFEWNPTGRVGDAIIQPLVIGDIGSRIADHLFIDQRGDGPWLVCVEKVFDTEDQARSACVKWQEATGGVQGGGNA